MTVVKHIAATMFCCVFLFCSVVAMAEGWSGVDEKVVKKVAVEAGRPPSKPLINIEGDALLFAFLCGGAAGGFAAGYYFRKLFHEKGESGAKQTDD